MLLFRTHSLSISHNKDSPVSRSNLERIPTLGKVMMCTLLICRRAQKALSWPLFMEENNWLTLIFAYWLQNLVSPTLGLSQILTSTIFGGGWGWITQINPWLLCCYLWAGSIMTRHIPNAHHSWLSLERGHGKKRLWKNSRQNMFSFPLWTLKMKIWCKCYPSIKWVWILLAENGWREKNKVMENTYASYIWVLD